MRTDTSKFELIEAGKIKSEIKRHVFESAMSLHWEWYKKNNNVNLFRRKVMQLTEETIANRFKTKFEQIEEEQLKLLNQVFDNAMCL